MAGKSGQPRRRKADKTSKPEKKKDEDAKETPAEQEEETAWQAFSSHWLIRYVLPVFLLYGGVQGHWYMQVRILQDPDSITRVLPFLKFRPPVRHQDQRQLLVVGTMSSGTRQIASSLTDVLGLEMGHERSDSESHFCRDGTVSWTFGMRFLEAPPVLKIAQLCQQATYAVGFHPRMYRGNVCSQNQQWSRCWAQECVDLLQTELGCALKPKGCHSFQPFQYTLHQTRKPMAVMESLVSKYCHQDNDKQKGFIRISSFLFHHLEDFDQLSCLEAVAHHVLEYNRALLKAREQGLVQGMYKIEQATPCHVADMAGLGNASRVVYPPNTAKFEAKCRQSNSDSSPGHLPMRPKGKYKVNKDRVRLSWTDFEGGKHESKRPAGDMSLVEDLKELTRALGYETE